MGNNNNSPLSFVVRDPQTGFARAVDVDEVAALEAINKRRAEDGLVPMIANPYGLFGMIVLLPKR